MYRSYIGLRKCAYNSETKCYNRELRGTVVEVKERGRKKVDVATVATPPSNFAVSSKLGEYM